MLVRLKNFQTLKDFFVKDIKMNCKYFPMH